MADYLLVYEGGGMPETEAEQAAVMKAWTDWFGELGAAVKDGGNPASGQTATIGSGSAPAVTGYSVISAGSLSEAEALAKGCPVLQGGATVHVIETFEVM